MAADKEENGRSPMGVDIAEEDDDEFKSTSRRTLEILLRLFPMSLCIVALILMINNSQTTDFASLSYSDLGAFRYLVDANGICAGYSILTAIVVAVPRPSTVPRAWTFFILDQVVTYVILGAGASSTEVIYLAYKGDEAVTWSQACGSFGGFCKKATASITLTFVVTLCYACLSLISSYRLFSKFDPPVSYTRKETETNASQG